VAASRIGHELKRGAAVHCVYLTDGGAVRDRESHDVLTSLGVMEENIHRIGAEVPIRDGFLVQNLDAALANLEQRMRNVDVTDLYCLAWEGGHHDHDASHLLAAAFAKRRGRLDRCRELPFYRNWGPLFRVMSPLDAARPWESRRITFGEGLKISLLAWKYRSQRKSWIGLFPEAFVKLALLRREQTRAVDVARFRRRPHEGRLHYERRFRVPYERFAEAAAPFIERHFS
jgi:hypothetical protein